MSAVVRNRFSASCKRLFVVPSGASSSGTGCSISRHFSSSSSDDRPDLDYIRKYYVVHRRGDPGHGSREYLLLPPDKTVEDAKLDPSLKAAALLAHRNILFGARSTFDQYYSLTDVCLPLVEVALKDAGENGEQPQAIASLSGLSDWVRACLEEDETASTSGSKELSKLKTNDPAALEAVQSIATGIPRKGHSVVGIGTYRDAEEGWKALATEFAERGLSAEVNLYQKRGAKLIGIEHMADKNPEYLQSAGGAMARLFFL